MAKSEQVRSATLNTDTEYGMAYKRTNAGAYEPTSEGLQTNHLKNDVTIAASYNSRTESYAGSLHGHTVGGKPEFFSGKDINNTVPGSRNYLVTPKGALWRFDEATYEITPIQAAPPRYQPLVPFAQ